FEDIAMTKASCFVVVAALVVPAARSSAQSVDPIVAVQQRLDALEQQNAELRGQLRDLREELDKLKPPAPPPADASRLESLEEKVDLQATRLAEHDAVKAESAHKVPLRLTGTLLFNTFAN